MATKRIIAHFMHETERDAALEALSSAERTDSYVIGNIDETQIPALEARGLLVEEVRRAAVSPLSDLSEALSTFSKKALPESAALEVDLEGPGIYTVSLDGPLLPAWRERLLALGVTLTEVIGPQLYLAELTPDQLSRLRDLPFVMSVHVHSEFEKSPPIPAAPPAPPIGLGFEPILTYDIRLRAEGDTAAVLARLAGRDALVAGAKGRKIRLSLRENSPLLAELRSMLEVSQILEFVPPKLFNDRARVLLGINSTASPPVQVFGLDGKGQIVGVADTGIDDNHPDLKPRLVGVVALGRTGDPSDPNGHGTHVAGSIAGDGTASNGTVRGMAPAAELFFQSVMDAGGSLGGLPLDLNDLFDEAYQAGARIHNNSWGASTASRYAFNSLEADEFVDQHRDMAIVIAAGNEGTARDPFSSQRGFVDWLSVGSPATAKNAITVGASRTDRSTGGLSGLTWGQGWPNDFPDLPIRDDKISGDPECMAGFSSRGPCDDRRIKPDVVAPGTDIASTKSSRAPLSNFWGSFPGHSGRYAYMGGTSMATPIVSGCLALIRQYYVGENHEPSAALLKATLVNSTRALKGQDSVADHNALPNFHQGFGRVHMPWAVPNAVEPALKLKFVDTWKDVSRQFKSTGERFRFRVTAGNALPLRFCLAYTDLPARALQNNLNLFVQSFADPSKKWVGNQDLPMRISVVDNDNNVEIVRIDAPDPGKYLIQVSAFNMLGTQPQDFALVVTGDLQSEIEDFP